METVEKQATNIEQTHDDSHEINRTQRQQFQQRLYQQSPRKHYYQSDTQTA